MHGAGAPHQQIEEEAASPDAPAAFAVTEPAPTAACDAAVTVEVARTLTEAERFQDFHERHSWHPEANWHLLGAALDARSDASLPYLMQVSRGGVPSALLVGQVVDAVVPWKVGYQVLHESRFRQVEVLHGGVLGEDSEPNARAMFDEVSRFLRRGGADAALLRHVRAGSAMHRVFATRPSWSCRDRLVPTSVHWRLRLPESFAAFVKGLSKKSREDLKRFAKRVDKQFGDAVSIVPMHRPDDLAEAMRVVEAVAQKTWQRALGAGFRDTVETRARWRTAAGRGWLRVHTLRLGGVPAAFCTGFQIGDTLWLEHIGFDPQFRCYQPGGHLLHRVIEQVCAEGAVRVVDFGVGDADYKRRICNESHEEVSIYVFAPTVKGLWLNGLRLVTAWIAALGRVVARRCGWIDRLKGRWRRKLATGEPGPG